METHVHVLQNFEGMCLIHQMSEESVLYHFMKWVLYALSWSVLSWYLKRSLLKCLELEWTFDLLDVHRWSSNYYNSCREIMLMAKKCRDSIYDNKNLYKIFYAKLILTKVYYIPEVIFSVLSLVVPEQ